MPYGNPSTPAIRHASTRSDADPAAPAPKLPRRGRYRRAHQQQAIKLTPQAATIERSETTGVVFEAPAAVTEAAPEPRSRTKKRSAGTPIFHPSLRAVPRELPVQPADEMPMIWSTASPDRLLAMCDKWLEQRRTTRVIDRWFDRLRRPDTQAAYRERFDGLAILAIGCPPPPAQPDDAFQSKADPFHGISAERLPVRMEEHPGSAHHLRMTFTTSREFWMRSRTDVILIAPFGDPHEQGGPLSDGPLFACRVTVEYGRADGDGRMGYTIRKPRNVIHRPAAPISAGSGIAIPARPTMAPVAAIGAGAESQPVPRSRRYKAA